MIKIDAFRQEQLSEYLSAGFATESFDLKNIEVDLESKRITAEVEFRNVFSSHYDSNDAIMHISDILSYRAIGQLIVGYNSVYFNCNKNELGELWQRKYSVVNRNLIVPEHKINVVAVCGFWREINKNIVQNWQFDAGNRAFYGDITCVLKRN
jgi:hypothetical protein